MKNPIHYLGVSLLALSAPVFGANIDTNLIEHATGLKGAWNAAEAVFKVSAPRNDVTVKVDDWKMPPFMGLTSWAAFRAGKKSDAMVMRSEERRVGQECRSRW